MSDDEKKTFKEALEAYVARRVQSRPIQSRLPVVQAAEIPPYDALVQNGWRPTKWIDGGFEREVALPDDVAAAMWRVRELFELGWRAREWRHPSLGAARVTDGGLWESRASSEELLAKFEQRVRHQNEGWRNFMTPIGPVFGEEGDVKPVEVNNCAIFLHRRAFLTGDDVGEIEEAFIGARAEPQLIGPLSKFAGGRDLSPDLRVETAEFIRLRVRFRRKGAFALTLIGLARVG